MLSLSSSWSSPMRSDYLNRWILTIHLTNLKFWKSFMSQRVLRLNHLFRILVSHSPKQFGLTVWHTVRKRTHGHNITRADITFLSLMKIHLGACEVMNSKYDIILNSFKWKSKCTAGITWQTHCQYQSNQSHTDIFTVDKTFIL